MQLESQKYKIRLIILAVIFVLSIALGAASESKIREEKETVDEIVEVIQSTTEEEFNEVVEEKRAEGITILSRYESKQNALDTFQPIQSFYDAIYSKGTASAVIAFILVFSGSIISIMMYLVFTRWLLTKIWKDIKKWLIILLQILFLAAFALTFIMRVILLIGVFGQIPFVIYTICKYIKTKKAENKDDLIEVKEEKDNIKEN